VPRRREFSGRRASDAIGTFGDTWFVTTIRYQTETVGRLTLTPPHILARTGRDRPPPNAADRPAAPPAGPLPRFAGHRLALRPPPHVVDPDHVSRVSISRTSRRGTTVAPNIDYAEFETLATQSRSFRQLSIHVPSSDVWLGQGAGRLRIPGAFVDGSFFSTLGVQPAYGRFFSLDEERQGVPVVVIGHGLWQREFGGRRDALGRTLRIEHRSHEIVE